ncbi:MAG: cytochrome P450 [Paracoccaceae bacterium]
MESALAWSLYLMSHDETVQARAREEARAVLGDQAAGADHLARAPYVEQVLQEAMRLYPPVGLLARNVLAPDQLYERDIRPRDTVFLNIYALHRHQLWWEGPAAFDPGNFAPDKVAARDRFQYLPFGAGPRICVGANFAMMQAQIILMTLVARFRFAPAGPPPTPVMHMTIRPEPGVTLQATPI